MSCTADHFRRVARWLLLLVALVAVSACRRPAPLLHLDGAGLVGHSVEGRPIECLALGEGPDVTMIIATIHGNENVGTPLVHRLVALFGLRPDLLEGRRVVVLPVANPDGYVANRRVNARGIDLNRNFATSNREDRRRHGTGLSEPESQLLEELLFEHLPNRIVSIHQPLACIDYDGPAEELAVRMAAHCGLPVTKLGSRPGSFGSFAGVELGIPIITLELPRSADRLSPGGVWGRYGPALVAAVLFPQPVPAGLFPPAPWPAWWLVVILVAVLLAAGLGWLARRRRHRLKSVHD